MSLCVCKTAPESAQRCHGVVFAYLSFNLELHRKLYLCCRIHLSPSTVVYNSTQTQSQPSHKTVMAQFLRRLNNIMIGEFVLGNLGGFVRVHNVGGGR